MINIERKLQHDWDLESFLLQFGCNSEDELFKLLNKEFSRKTAKSYIVRMKKNSENNIHQKIPTKRVNKPMESLEEESISICDETTIENSVEIQTEVQLENKWWLLKIINYFKRILK